MLQWPIFNVVKESTMEQAALSPLAAWGSFSVIIGSSAAVLIGLQFVVITLGAGMKTQAGESGMNAFASPTVVHFSTVLFISAAVSAPWPALSGARLALSIGGVAGLVYALIVARRMVAQRTQRPTVYIPVLEDWLFHVVL